MTELRARLDAVKGQWRDLAESSGIPYSTLTKIAQGKTRNPGFDTVQAIDAALRSLAAKVAGSAVEGAR